MPGFTFLVKPPCQQHHAKEAHGWKGPLVAYADLPSEGPPSGGSSHFQKTRLREERGSPWASRGGTERW